VKCKGIIVFAILYATPEQGRGHLKKELHGSGYAIVEEIEDSRKVKLDFEVTLLQ